MAGHSKWNNIKNRKGAADAKRGKVFSQLSKLIKNAVKEGGSGDPSSNASLRLLIDKARAANMPKDIIQRAIERGQGKSSSGAQFQDILYEGYGPGGVGIIVSAVTDNPNRTAGEVRTAFGKNSGTLAGPNSVAFMFSRTPQGEYLPTMPLVVTDLEQRGQIEKIVDALRENDDVEDVYLNVESWPELDE